MPINHNQEKSNEEHKEKKSRISFNLTAPKYSFSDIILPPKTIEEIDLFIALVKNDSLIFDSWGLGSVIKCHNLGVNLYGASGTGKTMAAHAIAVALNRPLLIVDYAEIESKYVGETSKNLVSLFDFAKDMDAVILFDEADAMLSKRVTLMNNATDVSVNQTRNVLLKLLDDYTGVIIYTTNFLKNFDIAFLRRIYTHIRFDLPAVEQRINLWEHYLTPALPIDNRKETINLISEIDDISGSDIATAVLRCAVIAAERKGSITADDISEAINRIKMARQDAEGNWNITSRKVSEEYALEKIGGLQNVKNS